MNDDYFPITRIHRADLEERGYDTSAVTDDDMKSLASKMGAAYVEHSFWSDLEIIADDLGIPKRK